MSKLRDRGLLEIAVDPRYDRCMKDSGDDGLDEPFSVAGAPLTMCEANMDAIVAELDESLSQARAGVTVPGEVVMATIRRLIEEMESGDAWKSSAA